MKRITLLMSSLLTAFTMVSFAATSFSQEGPRNPIEINIGKDKDKTKAPRDLEPDIRAFIEGAVLSVELFEVGPATVYVVDFRGQVVSSESTEGFEYESVSLRVPSRGGVYTLVIWGTYLYGEGTFTVE